MELEKTKKKRDPKKLLALFLAGLFVFTALVSAGVAIADSIAQSRVKAQAEEVMSKYQEYNTLISLYQQAKEQNDTRLAEIEGELAKEGANLEKLQQEQPELKDDNQKLETALENVTALLEELKQQWGLE